MPTGNTVQLICPAYLSGGVLTDPVVATWREFDPSETKAAFRARFDALVEEQFRVHQPDWP